eukprot:SAG11_NODE_33460_length_277_cov_0.584270_1_plen_56_part_01
MAETYAVGDEVRVDVHRGNVSGVVRYVGPTSFAAGSWLGIELADALGRNDGRVGAK